MNSSINPIQPYPSKSFANVSPSKSSSVVDSNQVTPDIGGKDIFTSADDMIASAKSSIKLEMYNWRNKAVDGKDGAVGAPGYDEQQKLLPLIVDAAKRGVNVQVVLDGSATPSGNINNADMVAYLKKNGVQVLNYPANTVNIDHVKLLVIDGKDALIGGMNWSSNSPINHDADVRIDGPAAKNAEQIFDEDWAFSGGKATSNPTPPNNASSGNIKFITTAPPEENGGSSAIDKVLVDDINGAKKSVHAEIYCFTDSDVIQAMKDAKARGVDVKVIFDPSQARVNQKTYDDLASAGIGVKWYNSDMASHQLLHAKWGVFDNQELIIGSANWTGNGLTFDDKNPAPPVGGQKRISNHEADVNINDSATASVFEQQFQNDWANNTRANP
ncbi:MAG: phosphatidylserine/phosphatidylglycerophosphate/cardiolipin synthase family protein [Firmicutes bacterium]|nr:phosphatidylserine/phosphatidylglycerophosphate/cardiolipin synthase family protein [Bacillota bacterium]